jgi:hypothetical protein
VAAAIGRFPAGHTIRAVIAKRNALLAGLRLPCPGANVLLLDPMTPDVPVVLGDATGCWRHARKSSSGLGARPHAQVA